MPEGAPPTIRCAAGVPGGRWGSVVYGWRAPRPRPPRVVFVLGFASLINSLTSGKKYKTDLKEPHTPPSAAREWRELVPRALGVSCDMDVSYRLVLY